jgi:hypothetical protein
MRSTRIDRLLSEEVAMPVVFTRARPEGIMEAAGKHGEKRKKEELPLWLAAELERGGLVRTQTPAAYGAKVRGMLEANPKPVDLGGFPYFAETGLRIAELAGDTDLARLLAATVLARI